MPKNAENKFTSMNSIKKNIEEDILSDDEIPIHNNIAIAIQYLNFNKAMKELEKTLPYSPALIEFRLDYNETLIKLVKEEKIANSNLNEIFDKEELRELIQFLKKKKIKSIFTLRRQDQGGKCTVPEEIRIELIKNIINFKPDYIDIESDTDQLILRELNDIARKNNVNIIYSYHNWNETPSDGKIKYLMSKLLAKCPETLPTKDNPNTRNIIKLIFTANHISDNYIALDIVKFYAKRRIRIVSFCMGTVGISSRVGSLLCGAYFSFASIGNTTAPGQLNIDEFKELLENTKE